MFWMEDTPTRDYRSNGPAHEIRGCVNTLTEDNLLAKRQRYFTTCPLGPRKPPRPWSPFCPFGPWIPGSPRLPEGPCGP